MRRRRNKNQARPGMETDTESPDIAEIVTLIFIYDVTIRFVSYPQGDRVELRQASRTHARFSNDEFRHGGIHGQRVYRSSSCYLPRYDALTLYFEVYTRARRGAALEQQYSMTYLIQYNT